MSGASRRCGLLLLGLVVVVGGGCGKPPPPLVPVAGRVLYRNKPVAGVNLQFVPDISKGEQGPTANGRTGADGSFRLQTPPYGEGAVKGFYRVTIAGYPGSKTVPTRYGRHDQTPLNVEVPEGG